MFLSVKEGVGILNIESDEVYFVERKFDYVDAVYSIDNETFCLCTKDLYNIFRTKYSQ